MTRDENTPINADAPARADARAGATRPSAAPARADASRPRADARANTALLWVMYGMALVVAFNENIINVALLEICESFSVSAATANWLITGYMIVTSIVTASMGFLFRRVSMRRLFLAATACLVVGEAACLVAPTFAILLPFRLLQAIGSGVILPMMMNTVLLVAPKERTGQYMAIGGACITLGPALGPVISGLAATLLGWRAIFVAPLVLGAALGIAGLKLVRNLTTTQDVSLDVPSLALMAAVLFLFVFGLGQVSSAPLVAVGCIAASLALLVVFTCRQSVLDEPFMDMRPLTNPGYWVAGILVVVAMMMTFSMSVLLPLYFEGSFGMTALAAGVLILPAIAVNAGTSIVGGNMMDRRGAWPLLPMGFACVALGQLGTAMVSGSLALVPVVMLSVVVYAGVGLVLSPSQTAGLRVLPQDQQGQGTALYQTFVMIAASIGSSLFVGIYSSGVAGALAAGLVTEQAQASGFSRAVLVAAVIAVAGLVVSVAYALSARRRERGGVASAHAGSVR